MNLWKKKDKPVVAPTTLDFSHMNLSDSERFVVAIGQKIEQELPEIMADNTDNKLNMRQMFKVGSNVLSGLITGNDDYGLKNVPFDLLIKEYKRIKKKATRPDSPDNIGKIHKIQ